MNSILKSFDIKRTLHRFAGSELSYLRGLKYFVNDYRLSGNKITGLLAAKEKDLANHLVHSLKGVSGNLGAKFLHAQCVELESVLRSGKENYSHVLTSIDEVISTTCAEIDECIAQYDLELGVQVQLSNEPNIDERLDELMD